MQETMMYRTSVRADERYFKKFGNAGWRLYAVIPEEDNLWIMHFRLSEGSTFEYTFPSVRTTTSPAETLDTYFRDGWFVVSAYTNEGYTYFYLMREL